MKKILVLLAIAALFVMSFGAPEVPPKWVLDRFTLNWFVVLEPGDVLFYYDDVRELHALEFEGGLDGYCLYGLDERSNATARLFGEPENETIPWMFCNNHSGNLNKDATLWVWSAPDYHLPYTNDGLPVCKDPVDYEYQVQDGCRVDWDDWFGYDKTLLDVVKATE